ncbi:MAG: putative toxin-antitoxin system toxin component, PIN family [Candidatus Scalinduaceae bacterium]
MKQKTKIVIDTNIFVASLFGDTSRKIIELWLSGKVNLCISEPIVGEYKEILRRFKFKDEEMISRVKDAIERNVNVCFIQRPEEKEWIPEDPDDNKFIACALALGADYVISSDSHLLKKLKWNGIKVIRPNEFIQNIDLNI